MVIFRYTCEKSDNGAWCFYRYCACHERELVRKAACFHVLPGKQAEFRMVYPHIEVDRTQAIEHSKAILDGKTTFVNLGE